MLGLERGAQILPRSSRSGVNIVYLGDYVERAGSVCRAGDIWVEPLEESRSFPVGHGFSQIS